MPDFRFDDSTFEAYETAQRTAEALKYKWGYIGKPDGAGGFVYEVPGEPGFIYVRIGRGDQFTIGKAVNQGSVVNPYQLVRMMMVNGKLVIERPDPTESTKLYGAWASTAAVPPHAGAVGSGNEDIVDGARLRPGRVYPSGDGMNVVVEAYPAAGLDADYLLDTTASIPANANERRWIVVYIDTDGVPQIAEGTASTLANNSALQVADARAIAIPAAAYPLFALSLYNGQTSISYTNTRFVDLRKHHATAGVPVMTGATDSADGVSGLVPTPTAGNETVHFLRKDGAWATPAGAGGGGTISGDVLPATCQGRLTLESGVAVSTSDQTAKTTVYFTPYRGAVVALYDGVSAWTGYTFTELSLSLAGLTADTNHDIFLYDDSGTLTLEAVAWTDSTTRATALATQNGVYVKTGATARRYLGTIRTTGTTGQCEDSLEKRLVYSHDQPVRRKLRRNIGTSYNYGTDAWRQANGSTDNKVCVVVGVPTLVSLQNTVCTYQSAAGRESSISIGLGSTTPAADANAHAYTSATELTALLVSTLEHMQAAGYQEYWMLEKSSLGSVMYGVNNINQISGWTTL